MRVLLASDLDRTLIYSTAALGLTGDAAGTPLICVERLDGRPISFMTTAAARLAAALAGRAVLMPVTTRVPSQLARVRLPGPPVRFQVAANGGVLLVDGVPDPSWDRRVRAALAGSLTLSDVWSYVIRQCEPVWTMKLRMAEDLFCYAVLNPAALPVDFALPGGFVARMSDWAENSGWTVSLQGRKLYWVPRGLTKSAAVAEVAKRVDAEFVVAAGDSLLDRDLLIDADQAIIPAHGELFESDFRAPNVRQTLASGVLAGQEILEWFGSVLAGCPSRAPVA